MWIGPASAISRITVAGNACVCWHRIAKWKLMTSFSHFCVRAFRALINDRPRCEARRRDGRARLFSLTLTHFRWPTFKCILLAGPSVAAVHALWFHACACAHEICLAQMMIAHMLMRVHACCAIERTQFFVRSFAELFYYTCVHWWCSLDMCWVLLIEHARAEGCRSQQARTEYTFHFYRRGHRDYWCANRVHRINIYSLRCVWSFVHAVLCSGSPVDDVILGNCNYFAFDVLRLYYMILIRLPARINATKNPYFGFLYIECRQSDLAMWQRWHGGTSGLDDINRTEEKMYFVWLFIVMSEYVIDDCFAICFINSYDTCFWTYCSDSDIWLILDLVDLLKKTVKTRENWDNTVSTIIHFIHSAFQFTIIQIISTHVTPKRSPRIELASIG